MTGINDCAHSKVGKRTKSHKYLFENAKNSNNNSTKTSCSLCTFWLSAFKMRKRFVHSQWQIRFNLISALKRGQKPWIFVYNCWFNSWHGNCLRTKLKGSHTHAHLAYTSEKTQNWLKNEKQTELHAMQCASDFKDALDLCRFEMTRIDFYAVFT